MYGITTEKSRNDIFYHKILLLLSLLAGIFYFAISFYILSSGHLHEDAYILFEYVKNISSGEGIVYYQGGEKAEGATDFLWLMLLSILNATTRLDIALAATFLNGLGMMLVVYTCLAVAKLKVTGSHIVLAILLIATIILSPLTAASVGGFSTLFYVGVSMLLVFFYWSKDPHNYLHIPTFAIVLALIRPDGVIVGVAFCLLTLYELRASYLFKSYMLRLLIAGFIGVVYFAWRYSYFGLTLPLPLYVKVANAGFFSGWESNLSWLLKGYIRILLIPLVLLFFVLDKDRKVHLAKLIIPFALLFIALGMSHQSQNIANRFQAPILGFLLFAFAVFLGVVINKYTMRSRKILFALLLLVFVLLNAFQSRFVKEISYLQTKEYINYFPYLLAEHIDGETVIALTEASRMAFWNDAQTFDLVGLNTVHTALYGVDVAYLHKLNADLIFVHLAGLLEFSPDKSEQWIPVKASDLETKLKANYRNEDALTLDAVTNAALVTLKYLAAHYHEWDLILVRYGDDYSHLYAINKNGRLNTDVFIEILDKSFLGMHQLPYLQIQKTREQRNFMQRSCKQCEY